MQDTRSSSAGTATRLLLIGAVTMIAGSRVSHAAEDLAALYERTTVIIEAKRVACYRFEVFLAISREQQIRGLMHVRELPDFSGMLFVYPRSEPRSMWMKNTYLSLDIVFIREDGTIANIAADTEPLSLESIRSSEPVPYVLELKAGTTATLDIDDSSRVHL